MKYYNFVILDTKIVAGQGSGFNIIFAYFQRYLKV